MSLDSPRAHYHRSRRAGSPDYRIFIAGVAEVHRNLHLFRFRLRRIQFHPMRQAFPDAISTRR
jgi:hypothetical protein